ncbi:MAG: ABC transporter permease [Solobacterium sp.]|jgi:simple sugar transport system permease protein|nr:ABC transporter permease [Solobacterium sp.]
MNGEYIAMVIHSVLQSTSPILLVALGSAVCSQVGIFNIALDAQMLIGCFAAIAVDYFTGSVMLSMFAGIAAGVLVSGIVALLQVKYKAADMVVGTALNLLITGLTSFMLFKIFNIRGTLKGENLVSMIRVNIPGVEQIPILGTILSGLTILDYLCYIIAFIIFIWLYKTVNGYHCQAVGINKEAAESLGTKGTSLQMKMVLLSGALCGLGGVALAMGNVTLFTENMTSGRGFMAMAAASMGMNHPLTVILTSLFFGACQGLGVVLQSVVKSQLTNAIPYIGTIIAMIISCNRKNKKAKKSK